MHFRRVHQNGRTAAGRQVKIGRRSNGELMGAGLHNEQIARPHMFHQCDATGKRGLLRRGVRNQREILRADTKGQLALLPLTIFGQAFAGRPFPIKGQHPV